MKNAIGGSTNLNGILNGVSGIINAMPTMPKLLRSKGMLGLLL